MGEELIGNIELEAALNFLKNCIGSSSNTRPSSTLHLLGGQSVK